MKKSVKFIVGGVALLGLSLIPETRAGAQKVIVNNGASNPVPVNVQNQVLTQRADEPARQRFQDSTDVELNSSNFVGGIGFNVPAGKRLVIELVTLEAKVPAGQNICTGIFTAKEGDDSSAHILVVTNQGQDIDGMVHFNATGSVRAYSDAGDEAVIVQVIRNAQTGNWHLFASVSGYLVDAP